MKNSFIKNLSLSCFLTAILTAVGFFLAGQRHWSLGVLVGTCWIFLNVLMLFRMIEFGLNLDPAKKNKVLLIAIVKFPVLYVAGYLVLRTGFFPVTSLLIGLTVFIVIFTLSWFKFNVTRQLLEKTI